jgi:hypothetical protein
MTRLSLTPGRLAGLFALLFAAPVPLASSPQGATARIVVAANVTLRALPSATAAPVAQLTLGTETTAAGPSGFDRTWVRVRLTDGREGWVLATLTRTLDPDWRWPTYDRIIEERLARKGDGFPALAELVAFVERVAPEYTDPDGRARVDLWRLRATAAAARAIPSQWNREPYASWLKAHEGDVIRHELAGEWILSNQAILALHTRHAATSWADDLAWLAVTNGLTGECEGVLTCYLDGYNRLQGEYLRREPAGRHATEAVGAIKGLADLLLAPREPKQAYVFDAARDCRDLTAELDALAAAVKGTHADNRDAALARLADLRQLCQERGTEGRLGSGQSRR